MVAMTNSLDKSENKVQIRWRCAFLWWKDCKNRSSISWDIWLNMPIFLLCYTRSSQMNCVNSEVTKPKFTKFLHNVDASFMLLMHTSRLRCPIPFWNAKATNEGSLPFFHKIGAMAMSNEISEKEVQVDHLHPKQFHSVKILQKSVQWLLR